MPESALNSPNPATESPAPVSNSKVSSASSKKSPFQQSTISLFAVQCGKCLKWRLIDTEEEYEEIRSKSSTEPFVCGKKPNVTCDDDADIEYDTSRTWVIDKPNIPIPPSGFKRKLVMRRDFSKLDAYYITPTGKKLRSCTEVSKYLAENPGIKGASVDAFSFQVPKIDEETVPKHVERKSSARAEKRARDANQ